MNYVVRYGYGFYSTTTCGFGLCSSVSTFSGDSGLTMGITLAKLGSLSPAESQDSQEQFTEELLERFIDSRATGISSKTVETYHFALDRFVGYPLTPEGINAYLNSLTCGNAKHNYYRCIKVLCRWLHRTSYLRTNPAENVLPPRRQKKLLSAISKGQLDILVANARSKRDKVILNLLWFSGMRLSEVAAVRAKDFDWREGTVVVLGKGNRFRKALAGNDTVRKWFSKHSSLGMTPRGIQIMLHRLGRATGIQCNAHSFRRGFCVYNVKLGLANKVIQALGGWETSSMVSHYAQSLTFEEALTVYRNANQSKIADQ